MSQNTKELFNAASLAADCYDGSEASYDGFFKLAIAFDQAANDNARTTQLLDRAIAALGQKQDFVESLKDGGAQIFYHGAVFIRTDPDGAVLPGGGEGKFEQAEFEPRLKEVVLTLQEAGIFYDDLIIDIGRVRPGQMRQYPYVIITIPRLNAQIAVADQKNEAIFVANPALDVMNWALFTKPQAGVEGSAFENVRRVVHAGGWEARLLEILLPETDVKAPKVDTKTYVGHNRKSKYPLTEEMVVEMAKMYRERHPEKKWPSQHSGPIPRDIIEAVTGDPHWQKETWLAVDRAGSNKGRGLTRLLAQILRAHNCHYDLNEEMVLAMARLYRARHPEKQWPSCNSGEIERDILEKVTGDPDWKTETWRAVDLAGRNNNRGLTRPLAQILDEHRSRYNLTEDMVIDMARMYRARHPKKQWPSRKSGDIKRKIIEAVTGDPHWPDENWGNVDAAGRQECRGLTRSLAQILLAYGCHYDLTEDMVVKMARLYRSRHPEKKWPSSISGPIPHDIIETVTGDTDWQDETWSAVDAAGRQECRGLTRSLAQILDAHCPERHAPQASPHPQP